MKQSCHGTISRDNAIFVAHRILEEAKAFYRFVNVPRSADARA
jgi:hypothetical protein